MPNTLITKKVIAYEIAGFTIVFAFLWADELFDLPHVVFGTVATPINWMECIIESSFTAILGVGVIYMTSYYLNQIQHLEGMLPVCSVCKKIRTDGEWVAVEEFVKQHSDADFTHGLCPDCARPYYQELEKMQKDKLDSSN